MKIVLKNLTKVFMNKKTKTEVRAVDNMDVEIPDGKLVGLLGPSGCGKSTTLFMISGLQTPSSGEIYFGENNVTKQAKEKRGIGLVFQNYALYPHMTVYDNLAFSLSIRKVPKAEIKERVLEVAKMLEIEELLKRRPKDLSGGQKQRVAIGSAIIRKPKALLMDEPLSNLDAKLRVEMRTAIREVQKQVGITTVYVTHDQEEALSISDRIAVMKKGEIQQTARPHTIYTRPYNVFVSTFIGHSNLFHGTIKGDANGKAVVFNDGYTMPMDNLSEDAVDGMEVIISVRPEEFSIQKDGVKCKIKNKVFLGKYNTYFLEFPENMLIPDQPSIEFSQDLGHAERLLDIDEEVVLRPNPAKVNIFTADGSRNLLKGVVLHE